MKYCQLSGGKSSQRVRPKQFEYWHFFDSKPVLMPIRLSSAIRLNLFNRPKVYRRVDKYPHIFSHLL